MADQPYHRKVELQSPDDLQYLISNIRRAAHAEIERSLPSLPGITDEGGLKDGKGDDMRVVVERLISEYIEQVLQTSSENITINGLPPSEKLLRDVLKGDYEKQYKTLEEYEQFDDKADRKTRDLIAEEDALIVELARLRREVPGRIVGREREVWKGVGEEDERVLEGLEKVERERGGVVVEGSVDSAVWGRGVGGLERMVGGEATEVGARKERAERAEGYVIGKK